VIDYLDQHSAGVVAVATIALTIVTAIYVGLTGGLLRTSQRSLALTQRSLDLLEAERTNRLRQFRGLVAKLRHLLGQLPRQAADNDPIRNAVLWKPDDPADLRRFVLEMLWNESDEATEAEHALTWLRDCAVKVRDEPKGKGYRWSEYERGDWAKNFEAADRALAAIDAKLNAAPSESD
jgi:hypothetical protein